MLSAPCLALVGLGLVRAFVRYMERRSRNLQALRDGAPALTPALTRAIQLGGPIQRPQLPLPPPRARLTPSERRVVEGIAAGSTPKELAYEWGLKIATVRTHIRHAKRKTGARTLAELCGYAGREDWPDGGDVVA